MKNAITKKMREIVKNGHIPCRYKQAYSFYHANLVNCFEHACYNLNEKELAQIDDVDFEYRPFAFLSADSPYKTCENYFDFLVDTGLDISNRLHSTLKNNQWLVSLYFANDMSDFHFLIKEKTGVWTAKRGFSSQVDVFKKDDYVLDLGETYPPYYKEDTYVLTNKYAEK